MPPAGSDALSDRSPDRVRATGDWRQELRSRVRHDQQEAERSARIEKDIAFRIELVQITTEAAATLEGAVNKYLTKGKGRKDLKEWAQASVGGGGGHSTRPAWRCAGPQPARPG